MPPLARFSRDQNQLSRNVAVLTAAVGLRSLGERVLVIDDDAQPPVVEEAHEPIKVLAPWPGDDGDGAASRPRDGPSGMTKDPERVHGHEHAPLADEALDERGVELAYGVEDNVVRAGVAREGFSGVVEDLPGAGLPEERQVPSTCHRGDLTAGCDGELQRHRSDAPGRAVNHDALPSGKPRLIPERLERSDASDGEASR